MANKNIVGSLAVENLPVILGKTVQIKKSQRENAKYPLYISTPIGPLHFNTRAGQDFLLDYGSFNGAPEPDAPAAPEPEPDAPAAPESTKPRKGWFSEDKELI